MSNNKEKETNLFLSTMYAEQMQKLRKQIDVLHRDVLSNEKNLWLITILLLINIFINIIAIVL